MTSSPTRSRGGDGRSRDLTRPPAPEPLAVPVADTHCHLDIADGPDGAWLEPAQAIALAVEAGVDRIVQIGCDLPGARWAVTAASAHPELVAGVALHPNEAPLLAARGKLEAALAEIDALAAHERVRAVGETGLDHFRTGEDGRAAQEESFRAHIAMAKAHRKPLVIHDRDAHEDVLRCLREEGAPDTVVFHCFSGDEAMARYCADRGWLLSFAGTVTFKNAQPLRDALVAVPRDVLLVETDAPYLTPTPHRGRSNASYLVPITVRAMADVRGEDVDELCGVMSATSDRVFGPW